MNKSFAPLIAAFLALSMLSSCGNYEKVSPAAAEVQQTVPNVTLQITHTSAAATSLTSSSTITTTTTAAPRSKIIKGINPDFCNNEIPSDYYIYADAIYQEPELPAGCEITSLTMLLNYLGFDIDKVYLCDNYLTQNYDYTKNFSQAFVGNPKDGTGFGCYAPVIADAAQKYLTDMHSDLNVYDISGTDFSDLFAYIADDKPVVIWASMSLVDLRYYNAWTMEDTGEEVWWYENEHCMLLTGYDTDNGTVTVCDPLKGEYTYDMYRFEEIYNQLEKQAVTIY